MNNVRIPGIDNNVSKRGQGVMPITPTPSNDREEVADRWKRYYRTQKLIERRTKMKKKNIGIDLSSIYRSIASKQILFVVIVSMWVLAFVIGGFTVAGVMLISKINSLEREVIRVGTKTDLLLPDESGT